MELRWWSSRRQRSNLVRALAAASGLPALRGADWRHARLTAHGPDLPETDLAVAAYLLGELDEQTQAALVRQAAGAAATVILVEPGTPRGYRRIVEARRLLLELGMTIYAPCPHDLRCPLVAGPDWCHFSARVVRSQRHRRLKDGVLGYEDEKFSYLVAGRAVGAARVSAAATAPARVLRHPLTRKGLVVLELCGADGSADRWVLSRRQGAACKAARKADWGDEWPPAESVG